MLFFKTKLVTRVLSILTLVLIWNITSIYDDLAIRYVLLFTAITYVSTRIWCIDKHYIPSYGFYFILLFILDYLGYSLLQAHTLFWYSMVYKSVIILHMFKHNSIIALQNRLKMRLMLLPLLTLILVITKFIEGR
jgi:hypothetical protein